MLANVPSAHAGCHARPHDGAYGRTGYRDRTNAQLIKRLYDMNMRETAGPTAAKGDGEGRVALYRHCSSAAVRGRFGADHQHRRLRGQEPLGDSFDLLGGNSLNVTGTAVDVVDAAIVPLQLNQRTGQRR